MSDGPQKDMPPMQETWNPIGQKFVGGILPNELSGDRFSIQAAPFIETQLELAKKKGLHFVLTGVGSDTVYGLGKDGLAENYHTNIGYGKALIFSGEGADIFYQDFQKAAKDFIQGLPKR